MLTLEQVRQARDRILGRVHRTPLLSCATLGRELGARVSLKLECLQKTGSFKPRGAFNKMLSLSAEERSRGVVAVSGGNHAQGVAYAAHELGIPATLCMPRSTPANYLEATRGYGAEVVPYDRWNESREQIGAQLAEERGLELVRPYDDALVMAGQGTAVDKWPRAISTGDRC